MNKLKLSQIQSSQEYMAKLDAIDCIANNLRHEFLRGDDEYQLSLIDTATTTILELIGEVKRLRKLKREISRQMKKSRRALKHMVAQLQQENKDLLNKFLFLKDHHG